MAITETTFNVHEIESFLCNVGQRFAQVCWHNDMVVDGNSDRVTYTQTSKWFAKFFPSNTNQFLFRLAEAHCTQHTNIEYGV
jgi:hypothetical protein